MFRSIKDHLTMRESSLFRTKLITIRLTPLTNWKCLWQEVGTKEEEEAKWVYPTTRRTPKQSTITTQSKYKSKTSTASTTKTKTSNPSMKKSGKNKWTQLCSPEDKESKSNTPAMPIPIFSMSKMTQTIKIHWVNLSIDLQAIQCINLLCLVIRIRIKCWVVGYRA